MTSNSIAIVIAGTIIGAFIFLGMWLFMPTYSIIQGGEAVLRLNMRNGDVHGCGDKGCMTIDLYGQIKNPP